MSNYVRISIHLVSLMISGYVLMGVDFSKFLRKGHKNKDRLMYILASIALAYLIAQFLLNISMSFVY